MRPIANHAATPGQMAGLLFSFMTGSSVIFVPGSLIQYAGNGSWISLLISMAIALFLVAGLVYMNRMQGGINCVQYCRSKMGTFAAAVLVLPFAFYLLIMVSWTTLGVSEFMTSTSMRNTPSYVFNGLILLSAVMTVRSGFEAMVRISILLFCILTVLIIGVLVLSLPNLTPMYLLPVLPDGWMPVMQGIYFTYGFPFGEVIVFAVLLHFVRNEQSPGLGRNMMIALLANGVLLIAIVLTSLMVFGPVAAEMKYSLYSVSRLIDVAEFFQRIESLIGISLIAGSYVKTTIALYALNELLTGLLEPNDDKLLVMPLAVISFLLTLVMFDYEAEFTERFTQCWPFINFICALLPLSLAGLFSMLHRRNDGGGAGAGAQGGGASGGLSDGGSGNP